MLRLQRVVWLGLVGMTSGCFVDSISAQATGGASSDGGASTVGGAAPVGGSGGEVANGGGGSGNSGGGGQGGGDVELDCTDGDDDDRDGDTDCEDSDCADFECLPPQTGAVGFAVDLAGLPGCDAPHQELSLLDCGSGCACSASNGSCDIHWEAFTDANCSSLVGTADGPTCLDNNDGNRSFRVTWFESGAATCAPSGGTTFQGTSADACSYDASDPIGTCGGGGRCIPKLPGSGKRCAIVPAAQSCDAPYLDAGTRSVEDGDDTCSCSCDVESSTCPGAFLTAHSNSDFCGGSNIDNVAADGACHDTGFTESIGASTFSLVPQCQSSASKAQPSSELRFCCVP